MNTKTKIPFLCTCFFIGITSFITATVFFSWYYHIANLNPSTMTDLVAEPVVYLIHAVGMLLFSLFLKRNPSKILDRTSFLVLLFAWFLFSFLSVVTNVIPLVYAFGLLASLFTGFLFGYYLTALAGLVPGERRGLTFGIAGVCSSVGTWLISLPFGGTFLSTKGVWILYGILTVLAGYLGLGVLAELKKRGDGLPAKEDTSAETVPRGQVPSDLFRFVICCGITIAMVNLVLNIGFGISSEDVAYYGFNPEYSRAFYSIGLLIAGILHDRSRKMGIMISSITLILPFVSWLLLDNMIGALAVWIVGYVLQGFFSISRILIFADPAGEDGRLLYLAPFGYVFGRIGEMSGILIGTAVSSRPAVLLGVTFVFFAAALILWFLLYDHLYSRRGVAPTEVDERVSTADALAQTELSPRESEVLGMLLEGLTLKEIAGNLFISENTVKFHVKNIYRKTDCNNRKELLLRYQK
jgi:DNA-binding CsgD family transcriptional regulator